ncbi:NUDIX domain-containing protein [Nocardioides sp.]|uniref:NUDIX domain-containing protein n=1 Tax=Nocardioides sp. TaxID=35761 RepID=UPI00286BED1A|nr:NUDIX domain-containing protein [Nocardioides sp.]
MVDRVEIAVAALVRDGRVLLAHRHLSRTAYPDCWDLVGGHVEPGELPEQAVVRECLEELGVHVRDPRPLAMPVVDPALDLHAFVVTRWDGEPVNAAPDEHDDLRWFRPDELAGLRMAHPAGLACIVDAVDGATTQRG